MGFGVSISKKKGGGFDGIQTYMEILSREYVEAGFFEEMGVYPSERNTDDWTYAQLMGFHELQVDFTARRPVFGIASKMLSKTFSQKLAPSLKRDLTKASKGFLVSSPEVLNTGGRTMLTALTDVFGRTPPLAPNTMYTKARKGNRNTPMVETGELQEGLRFRNSITKRLQ